MQDQPLQKINHLIRDEFGRPSGVLLLNKPAGITSHDLVNQVRQQLHFKRVGHAGALDTFSSGLMLILVGKATKFSDALMKHNKSYKARVILGIATDTQDPEGVITYVTEVSEAPKNIDQVLKKFIGKNEQYVSLFSSVKVKGNKLRVLMRDQRYDHKVTEQAGKKIITFIPKEKYAVTEFTLTVPKKEIEIEAIKLIDQGGLNKSDLPYQPNNLAKIAANSNFFYLDLEIACSKGTYIRQFAEDLGEKLNLPASLIALERIKIGKYSSTQAIKLQDLTLEVLNGKFSELPGGNK